MRHWIVLLIVLSCASVVLAQTPTPTPQGCCVCTDGACSGGNASCSDAVAESACTALGWCGDASCTATFNADGTCLAGCGGAWPTVAPTPTCGTRVTVVNTLDDHDDGCCDAGDCTLREVVNTSNGSLPGDTITFSVTGTITLTLGVIALDHNLTITGPGSASLAISGNDASRIFLNEGSTIALSDLTLTHARSGAPTMGGALSVGNGSPPYAVAIISRVVFSSNVGVSLYGGAVGVDFCSRITLQDCSFSDNSGGDYGGAVYITSNSPHFTQETNCGGVIPLNIIDRSTFTSNIAPSGYGGAVAIDNLSYVNITNCTFQGNHADTRGGALELLNRSTVLVNNVTLSGNSAPIGNAIDLDESVPVITIRNTIVDNGASACTNVVWNAEDHNIDAGTSCGFVGTGDLPTTDALLAALANNGGPTQTMAIDAGSPAYNAGDNATCEATDQRGVTRPQATTCDIGAFEFEPPTPTPTVTETQTITPTITATARSTRTPTRTPSITPTATPTGQVPLDDNTHWNTTEYTIEHGSPRITHEQQCLDANFAPRDPLVCRCVTWFQRIVPPGTILWLARCPGDETPTILRVMGPIR